MMKSKRYFLTAIFLISINFVYSQYTFFRPEGSFAIEVSLENTELKRLPIYRNAITSLCVIDNLVLAGTCTSNNTSPFLFLASLKEKEVLDTLDLNSVVGNQYAIKSGFVKDKNNLVYAGTLATEGKKQEGHLLKIKISKENKITVADLGAPVAGEGIFSLTSNDDCSVLYGISYPSGYFFSYNIESQKTKIYEKIAPSRAVTLTLDERFSLSPEDYLSDALVADQKGFVYGSLPFGKLFCYDAVGDSVFTLEEELPFVWGRESIGQIESWLKTKDGQIYGVNAADGLLFKFDPNTHHIKNLGKPIMTPGISGLVEAADGKIYGVAGNEQGYAHLFSYDEKDGFIDYGNPDFFMKALGMEKKFLWRGFQISTIAASDDGKYIVMGENESLSQLMVFQVK